MEKSLTTGGTIHSRHGAFNPISESDDSSSEAPPTQPGCMHLPHQPLDHPSQQPKGPLCSGSDDTVMPLYLLLGGWAALLQIPSCFAFKTPQKYCEIGGICCAPLSDFLNGEEGWVSGRLIDLATKGCTAKRQKPNLHQDLGI